MKVKLTIEVEIDEAIYGTTNEEKEWLFDKVLVPDGLLLHSNLVGDTVGGVTKVICKGEVAIHVECDKEAYLLEYFGIDEFEETQKVEVNLGILTDLLYGWDESQNKTTEK